MKLILVFCLLQLWMPGLRASSGWGYDGPHGPSHWDGVCKEGKSQSPINLAGAEETSAEPFEFEHYDSAVGKCSLTNNGHTVKLTFTHTKANIVPRMSGGGLPSRYAFAQFHLHWGSSDTQGSEHLIQNVSFPLELHMVHFNTLYGETLMDALAESNGAHDALAVLAIMFVASEKHNADLEPVINALHEVHQPGKMVSIPCFPIDNFFSDEMNHFFRYNGSLTTPDCNEVVIWTIFKSPVAIGRNQLSSLRHLISGGDGDNHHHAKQLVDNFRPVQPLHRRRILDVTTTTNNGCKISEGNKHLFPVVVIIFIGYYNV